MAGTVDLDQVTVNPVVCGREQDSRDVTEIDAVDGAPLARVHSAPALLAQVAVRRVREGADGVAPGPEVFAKAAELYGHATLAGDSIEQHKLRVARAVGLPLPVVNEAVDGLCEVLADSERLNRRDVPPAEATAGGRTLWTPCGRVFASAASLGKHPGPNRAWLRALALGYSVMIRPGHRDPFSAQRLVQALLDAGLPPHKVTLLPGADDMARVLLRSADRSIVFGVEEKVRGWLTTRGVDVHCEGRSKVLIDHEPDGEELRFLTQAVAGEAGVRCDNASVVLTTGDPEALAERIAEELAAVPALPSTDEHSRLPTVSAAQADQLRTRLRSLADGMNDHTRRRYGGDALAPLEDGSYAVRPTVLSTNDGGHPTVGTELPVPFVTVVPWRPGDGLAPLSDSLVLTLLGDAVPAEDVAADATVRQVVCGPVLPWDAHPDVPDRVLGLLLMEPKHLIGAGVTP
jgi:acyl-CoA reductase-like NAD-dependent aldehyde dehydrogenase